MSNSPKVVGVIPARYASTRFPGKPLATICGKSLIQHTYENAAHCTMIDALVVATDDARIYEHVKGFGGNAAMTSEKCRTGTDRVAEAIETNPTFASAEIIVNIQGDEPLLEGVTVDRAIKALLEDREADMSTVATSLRQEDADNPHIVKCVMNQKGNALYFSRSLIPGSRAGGYHQGVTYYRHVGLYLFRRDFLSIYRGLPHTPLQEAEDLEQLKVLEHGYRIKVLISSYEGLEVNTPEDIQKVEKELCKQNTSL